MWMIGIAAGALALLAGFLVEHQSLRLALKILGAVLLVSCLTYGGLVAVLLGGIN